MAYPFPSHIRRTVILFFTLACHALALVNGRTYSYFPENEQDTNLSRGFVLFETLHLVPGDALFSLQAAILAEDAYSRDQPPPVVTRAQLRHADGLIAPGQTFGWTVNGGFASDIDDDAVQQVTVHVSSPSSCAGKAATVVVHGKGGRETTVRAHEIDFRAHTLMHDMMPGDVLLVENVGSCEAKIMILDMRCKLHRAEREEL